MNSNRVSTCSGVCYVTHSGANSVWAIFALSLGGMLGAQKVEGGGGEGRVELLDRYGIGHFSHGKWPVIELLHVHFLTSMYFVLPSLSVLSVTDGVSVPKTNCCLCLNWGQR